jgi:hypothetical protein
LWTPKLLNSKHFHRGWTRKPHEHKPNSRIGKVRYIPNMRLQLLFNLA